MAVTAAEVKQLREKTGAGMMDCKQALQQAEGDFAKAERILKELGKAAAAKRSGRATGEGRIFIAEAGPNAAIVELACETDFVARNEQFVALGEKLAREIAGRLPTQVDAPLEAGVSDAVGTLKENMSLRRFATLTKGSNDLFAGYIHGDSGRMGAVVQLRVDDPALLASQRVQEFAFDTALHAVAFKPTYLSVDDVDPAYRQEQEEIFTAQAKTMDKPEKVMRGIIAGRLKKHLAEICFLEQGFVKDEKTSVHKAIDATAKEVGGKLEIVAYRVFVVGEEV